MTFHLTDLFRHVVKNDVSSLTQGLSQIPAFNIVDILSTNNDQLVCHASECGHDECLSLLLSYYTPHPEHIAWALRKSCAGGHTKCAHLLISFGDPSANEGAALMAACVRGHIECLKILIPFSLPFCTHALSTASMFGHLECVQALIPYSNPKDKQSQALQWAAQYGHIACVQALIPVSDPKTSLALSLACREGNKKCVDLLLRVSDPTFENSIALYSAVQSGQVDIVNMLICVCDPKANHSSALLKAAMLDHQECLLALYPHSSMDEWTPDQINCIAPNARLLLQSLDDQKILHEEVRSSMAHQPSKHLRKI